MQPLPLRVALATAVLALAAGGCAQAPDDPTSGITIPVLTTPAAPAPTSSSPSAPVPTSTPPAQPPATRADSRAEQQLVHLKVLPRPRPADDYDRDAFGPAWSDTDGNGCNQRDDVLLRDAVRGTVRTGRQGRCDHDVLAGTWADPYAGRLHRQTDMKDLSQAQAIQIDHVVPLAEAWVSGARDWSPRRRELYATYLPGLLAVDGPTNASKGASDPAAWRPRKAYQCAYARRWIAVKQHWALTVDPSEVNALREMLGYC